MRQNDESSSSPESSSSKAESVTPSPDDWDSMGKDAGKALKNNANVWHKLKENGNFFVTRANGQSRIADNTHLMESLEVMRKPSVDDLLAFLTGLDTFTMQKNAVDKKGPQRKAWLKEQAKSLKKLMIRQQKKLEPGGDADEEGQAQDEPDRRTN